ncbi:MAG: hypothetical protein Q8O31_06175 [Rhodocyclaceae bacterium]|nr:hypothetical protein [Rhodocyclaceae bacterium]
MRVWGLFCLLFLLTGCLATAGVVGGVSASNIAKTDIDRVSDIHYREIQASVRLLTEKLYRRNPREWKKGNAKTLEEAVARVVDAGWRPPELERRTEGAAILVALSEDFRGDRVAAFVGGLSDMLHRAFNGKSEFFIMDDLNPQSIYNSARNAEIAAWKLSSARVSGELLLLSNEMTPMQNLSFEREFGKIISSLDTLSKIVADKTHRVVVKVLQSVATAVFLPIF